MIQLTSLKGEAFYLNPDLVEKIEKSADTIITVVGGNKLRVSEEPDEIVERFIAYKRSINYIRKVGD